MAVEYASISVPLLYYIGILVNSLVLFSILRKRYDTLWTPMGKMMTILVFLFFGYSLGMAVLWSWYTFFWMDDGRFIVVNQVYGAFSYSGSFIIFSWNLIIALERYAKIVLQLPVGLDRRYMIAVLVIATAVSTLFIVSFAQSVKTQRERLSFLLGKY
ncbi:hypothetical protein BDR26DRAFT_848681 [Obelidium mucronatum]|nr:hypothetical protein BDR26DRAFT_848681 [Obelidium mucronatum]